MGKQNRNKMPGLFKRNEIWWIDKKTNGQRIQESTGTSDYEEAEMYLIHRLEEIRLARVYGIRTKRTFREAAIKYLKENEHKRSIDLDAWALDTLDPFIGDLTLELIHMGTLQAYITERKTKSPRYQNGVKNRTVNTGLEVVRRILNLAANDWQDEYGLTWLQSAPKIKLLNRKDERKPYPLNWEEQAHLCKELPLHLRRMAIFAVNTGCRSKEICRLCWEWEIPIPELDTSVFIIPGDRVKNTEDRLVILNENAKAVVNEVRGDNLTYVFTYKNKPVSRIHNSAWRKARIRANLPRVRVHDLKHTFGRRLRAAGVSFEDRQDLLGHKSSRITTHYSAAEIHNLLEAANKVCREVNSSSVLTILERGQGKTMHLSVKSNKEAQECKLSTLALNGNNSTSYNSPT
jgi:integrase